MFWVVFWTIIILTSWLALGWVGSVLLIDWARVEQSYLVWTTLDEWLMRALILVGPITLIAGLVLYLNLGDTLKRIHIPAGPSWFPSGKKEKQTWN